MDQNNEQFRPEEQNNAEAYRYTVSADLTENGYIPQNTPKKRQKSDKKIKPLPIVLASLTCVLVLCFVAVFAILLPLNEETALANTFKAVFFDPTDLAKASEMWAESGVIAQIDLDLPQNVTSLQKDLHIGIDTAQTPDGKNKVKLLLDSNKIEYAVELIYDEETVAIGGFCPDDQYVTVPRKNIAKALDDSILHPESDSDYALDQDNYDELRDMLELLDPEYEDPDSKSLAESFDLIAEQILPYLKPKTSIYFADGEFRLCKDVTYTLDTEDINEILDIIIDEAKDNDRFNETFSFTLDETETDSDEEKDLARDLKRVKKEFEELSFELTYTVSGKKITDLKLSMRSVNKDDQTNSYDLSLGFVYGENKNGFDATLTTVEEEKTKYTIESEIEYRKKKDGDETVCEAEIQTTTLREGRLYSGDPIEEESTVTLTYDPDSHKYNLSVEGEDKDDIVEFEGKFKLSPKSAEFEFSLDEILQGKKRQSILSDFCEIKLEKIDSKDAFDIPDGSNLLAMDNAAFTDFLRNLQIQDFDRIMYGLTGQSLGIPYTADEKVLVQSTAAVAAAEKYCKQFSRYLSAEDTSTRQNSAFVYDKELDLYVLMDYYPSTKKIHYNFAYELTEQMLNKYHEATPTPGGSMTVHKLIQTEFTPATCTTQGKRVYHCEICDKTMSVKIEPFGHNHSQTLSVPVTTDDGVSRTATLYYCQSCGIISHGEIPSFCIFYVSLYKDGAYRLDDYVALGPWKQICIPDELHTVLPIIDISPYMPLSVDALSVRIPKGVTTIYSKAFNAHKQLQVLVIPSSLTFIDGIAFSKTNLPRIIFYCGTEEMWNSIRMVEDYRTLWKDVQIIFCPEGVTGKQVADSIIDPNAATNALEQKKQQVKTPEAVRALAASNASVTLFDDSTVQAAAYDETTDLVALCKAYNGTSTDILLYNASTGALVKNVTVNDHIHTIDIKNGYLAMASKKVPIYYVYTVSSETMKTVEFKTFFDYNYTFIRQVIVAGTKVYACDKEQHCHIECYDLETDTQITVARMYEPFMKFYPEQERLVVLDMNCSPGGVCFINSTTAKKITEIGNYNGFSNKNNLKDGYVTDNGGGMYDLNGQEIQSPPASTAIKIPLPEGSMVLETILSSANGSVEICANINGKVSMLLRTSKSAETVTVDYYAESAIVTKSGDVLLFTEGGCGLILLKMN